MRARLRQRAPAVVQRATVWGLGLPRPLLVVLLLGVAVRVGLFVLLPDGILHNNDSAAYLSNGLFDDPRQPSGYYFVLALLRAVDDSLWPIYVAQHLLGLGGGLLVYLAGREIGLRPLGAAIAALPLLVGSEQLYLEHTVLADGIFVVEVAAVLFLALRALRGGPGWWAATGAVLGYAALTRSIGVPLAVAVTGWLLVAMPRAAWLARLRFAAAAIVPLMAVLAAYEIAAASEPYDGLSDLGGRYAYARVAQFADCDEFTPPTGTRVLCDSRPSRERPLGSRRLAARTRRRGHGGPPRAGQVPGHGPARLPRGEGARVLRLGCRARCAAASGARRADAAGGVQAVALAPRRLAVPLDGGRADGRPCGDADLQPALRRPGLPSARPGRRARRLPAAGPRPRPAGLGHGAGCAACSAGAACAMIERASAPEMLVTESM